MSLLRIYASLADSPEQCQWVLFAPGSEPVEGEGPLSALPHRAACVQLVLPASQVLITRANLPEKTKQRNGSMLGFAIEEQLAGEPDASVVSWLGTVSAPLPEAGNANAVLAATDRLGLELWRKSLDTVGIREYEIQSEIFLLPWEQRTWSLAWGGREGFVRTAAFEGAATDCGNRDSPPLLLQMALEEAKSRGMRPESISVYATDPDVAPDIAAWQRVLGVPLRIAGNWSWRDPSEKSTVSLARERRQWYDFAGLIPGLRPTAWIAGAALAIHATCLVTDWALLAHEHKILRQQMEARFRAAFPDAVAVADPVLQMRRKLAEARHAAGRADSGDFLPLLEKVAREIKEVPPEGLRVLSYESGRLTLEVASLGEVQMRKIVDRLLQVGLSVDSRVIMARAGDEKGAPPIQRRGSVITVRSL